MAIGAILGQTFNAGNGIDINARDILAKLSSDADNGITFGSDGGLFVESASGKRTCKIVIGTSTAGWTSKDCDYLCTGTGDSNKINTAIQSLPSTGGEIVILSGTYNINQQIIINNNNIMITGNGKSTVLKYTGSFTGAMIKVNGDYVSINNINCNGNSSSNSSTGIMFYGSYGIAQNNYIHNFGNSGLSSINPSNYLFFSENICVNNKNTGIFINSSNTIINGNVCSNNNKYGIVLNSPTLDCNVFGNIIQNNNITNLDNNGDRNIISNNTIFNGTGTSSDYSSTQNNIDNSGSDNLIIGNIILGKAAKEGGTSNTYVNNKV